MKFNTRLLFILFLLTNFLGISLIVRPSLGEVFLIEFLNEGLLSAILLICYPVYIVVYTIALRAGVLTNTKTLLLRAVFTVALLVLICSYYLRYLEITNYPNYVYTTFHIYLPFLEEFATLQGIVVILFLIFETVGKSIVKAIDTLDMVKSPFYVVGVIVAATLVHNILKLPAILMDEYKNQLAIIHSKQSLADTLIDLPVFGRQGVFLRDNIPTNAVVFHPSQSWDFPELGNQVLLRYFLYPRVLVSPGKLSQFTSDHTQGCELYSVLAANYDRGATFPDYDNLEFEELTYLGRDGKKTTLFSGIYNGSFAMDNDVFVGIIKHRKCAL